MNKDTLPVCPAVVTKRFNAEISVEMYDWITMEIHRRKSLAVRAMATNGEVVEDALKLLKAKVDRETAPLSAPPDTKPPEVKRKPAGRATTPRRPKRKAQAA